MNSPFLINRYHLELRARTFMFTLLKTFNGFLYWGFINLARFARVLNAFFWERFKRCFSWWILTIFFETGKIEKEVIKMRVKRQF